MIVEPTPVPTPRATIVAWGVLIALGVGAAIVWFAGGTVVRGVLASRASLAAFMLTVRWFTRV